MAKKQNIKDIDEITDVNESTEVIAPVEEVAVEPIKEVVVDDSPRFKKSQLMKSDRYGRYAHLLDVYLKEGETYTLKAVDEIVNDLTKR